MKTLSALILLVLAIASSACNTVQGAIGILLGEIKYGGAKAVATK